MDYKNQTGLLGYTMNKIVLSLILYFFSSMTIHANQADVIDVKATQSKDKSWRFDVTVKHMDEGWDHYANEWVVLSPERKVLAKRTLYHPHVNEQPFTRNIQGVKIPEDIEKVTIVARDSVHGIKGKSMEINLTSNSETSSEIAKTDISE